MVERIIAICGMGIVGKAISLCLSTTPGIKLLTFDKYTSHKCNSHKYTSHKCNSDKCNSHKYLSDNIAQLCVADILFLCLPTPFNEALQRYDTTEIDKVLEELAQLQYKGIILLKSTVEPTYCVAQNAKYPQLHLLHNPEFLTAQTAARDFAQQTHIILGYTPQSEPCVGVVADFYRALFPLAEISITPASVAGVTKLACNAFYAVKIQYFTEIYGLCQKLQISYDEVVQLMLKNGWLNAHHTQVPGPDQQISYGGLCFPKDVAALNAVLAENGLPHGVLAAAQDEQRAMRG